MRYYIEKALLLYFICIMNGILQASPNIFYNNIMQQIKTELPCSCICHKKTYGFKKCSICHHHGGKFMPSPCNEKPIEQQNNDTNKEEK